MSEGPATQPASAPGGNRVCRACGAELTLAGGSFCTGCGAPLEPAESVTFANGHEGGLESTASGVATCASSSWAATSAEAPASSSPPCTPSEVESTPPAPGEPTSAPSAPESASVCDVCGAVVASGVAVCAECEAAFASEPANTDPAPAAPVSDGAPSSVRRVKPLSVTPGGLVTAGWVAGIFAVLSVIGGVIAYENSGLYIPVTGQTIGKQSAYILSGVAIGSFWAMIAVFCAGLHGHLDRIARIMLTGSAARRHAEREASQSRGAKARGYKPLGQAIRDAQAAQNRLRDERHS